MPDRAYLHPIDPELVPGARNAIDVCLRLKPEERITVITDTVTREIAAALQREVERVGSDYTLFVLEHHARRPLKFMPEIILDDLALSQVSIFAAQTQPDELPARTQMTSVVNNHKIRHAHMVNINRQIMLEGMRADFCAVDELSQRLVERARQVDRITCKTPSGTEFEAELSPKLKWLKTSQSKWKIIGFAPCVPRTRICATNFSLTPAQTKTAIGSANLRSAPISPARISLGTFYRMKNFPVFTLPLVILTPNTLGRTGLPKRTSTAWAAISMSGSMANR